jgi:hypothetical protein
VFFRAQPERCVGVASLVSAHFVQAPHGIPPDTKLSCCWGTAPQGTLPDHVYNAEYEREILPPELYVPSKY